MSHGGEGIILGGAGGGAGGGGTPGGADGQVQFNDAGAFGGIDWWTVDSTPGGEKVTFNGVVAIDSADGSQNALDVMVDGGDRGAGVSVAGALFVYTTNDTLLLVGDPTGQGTPLVGITETGSVAISPSTDDDDPLTVSDHGGDTKLVVYLTGSGENVAVLNRDPADIAFEVLGVNGQTADLVRVIGDEGNLFTIAPTGSVTIDGHDQEEVLLAVSTDRGGDDYGLFVSNTGGVSSMYLNAASIALADATYATLMETSEGAILYGVLAAPTLAASQFSIHLDDTDADPGFVITAKSADGTDVEAFVPLSVP